MRSRTASPAPEMMDSLVDRAAPMAGSGIDDKLSAPPDSTTTTSNNTRYNNVNTAGDGKRKPVLSIFKRRTSQSKTKNLGGTEDATTSSRRDPVVDEKTLSIVADGPMSLAGPGNVLVITNPDVPGTPGTGRLHLAQQADPTGSVNCPYAVRLQSKLRRPPTCTSPRLCTRETNNRDSVGSTATCTTCNSSPTSPLFAFSSFMKTPSLGFLKGENSSAAKPTRGSGWSVWFGQEDNKDQAGRGGGAPPPPPAAEIPEKTRDQVG